MRLVRIVNTLNSNIFKKAPDDVGLFDDIGGIFNLTLDVLAWMHLSTFLKKTFNMRSQSLLIKPLIKSMLLISSYYGSLNLFFLRCRLSNACRFTLSYLYQPNKWGKFCKITTFIYIHRYMSELVEQCNNTEGYYEDIKKSIELDVKALLQATIPISLVKQAALNFPFKWKAD